jgi:hypothetical protein
MKQEVKDRFKTHWKKLVVAVIGLGAVVYFIATGNEIDPTAIVEFLQ